MTSTERWCCTDRWSCFPFRGCDDHEPRLSVAAVAVDRRPSCVLHSTGIHCIQLPTKSTHTLYCVNWNKHVSGKVI